MSQENKGIIFAVHKEAETVDMRRIFIKIMTAAAVISSLCACSREGFRLFRGDYSFKTSGTISVVRDEAFQNDASFVLVTVPGDDELQTEIRTDTVITVHDDTLTVAIDVEAGQMNIAELDRENGEVMVTMNVTGGGVAAFRAFAEGRILTLTPYRRHMKLVSGTQSIIGNTGISLSGNVSGDFEISGSAERYEDIVLFSLEYGGDFILDDILYHIVDSDILCRARKNE